MFISITRDEASPRRKLKEHPNDRTRTDLVPDGTPVPAIDAAALVDRDQLSAASHLAGALWAVIQTRRRYSGVRAAILHHVSGARRGDHVGVLRRRLERNGRDRRARPGSDRPVASGPDKPG